MLIKELIGKTITAIYIINESEPLGLNKAECFIEIENGPVIDLPYGNTENIWIKELNPKAINIFGGSSPVIGAKIVNFLWYDEWEKGYLLLENGYLISEVTVIPYGLQAGLYIYESLNELTKKEGSDFYSCVNHHFN